MPSTLARLFLGEYCQSISIQKYLHTYYNQVFPATIFPLSVFSRHARRRRKAKPNIHSKVKSLLYYHFVPLFNTHHNLMLGQVNGVMMGPVGVFNPVLQIVVLFGGREDSPMDWE